jgi:hypothetical protein
LRVLAQESDTVPSTALLSTTGALPTSGGTCAPALRWTVTSLSDRVGPETQLPTGDIDLQWGGRGSLAGVSPASRMP